MIRSFKRVTSFRVSVLSSLGDTYPPMCQEMRYNFLEKVYSFIGFPLFRVTGCGIIHKLISPARVLRRLRYFAFSLPRCPFPWDYLSPGSSIKLLLRVGVFSNCRQSMLPCTPALLPLQPLICQFQMLGKLHTTLTSGDAVRFSAPH